MQATDMPSNVGAKMEQLNLKFTDFAQNTCTAHYLMGLEKKGLLLNWIGSLCVHNCVKLSVMIDHRNALNLLAVQIVQWKIVRQKAVNMCLKASEKTSADPAGPLPPGSNRQKHCAAPQRNGPVITAVGCQWRENL